MEKRQIEAKAEGTSQAVTAMLGAAGKADTNLPWDEEMVAALVAYAETLRVAFETLREKGYRIVDGIIVSPNEDV